MRNLLVSLLLLVSTYLHAQKSKTVVMDRSGISYNKAKDLYDKGKYADAIPYYEEYLQTNGDNQDALYYAGLCYRYSGNPEKAIERFGTLKKLNPDYWSWFYYEEGIAFSDTKQFDQAVESFKSFLKRYPNNAKNAIYRHQAMYKMEYASQRKALLAEKPRMKEPVKLSTTVNSPYPDYMPMLDPTGEKLYFTSKRLGGISTESSTVSEGDEDVYYIVKSGSEWGAPQLLPEPINSNSHEGAECFSADGQMMVYTACGRDGGIGSCDLYVSTLDGNQWSVPVNMGNVVNSAEWDSQPTISFDGNKIIFVSSRPGGYGSEDLYMIEKNRFGEWGPAMNLGGAVNTPFSDASPFLSQDGKTLYFSSAGHPGYGGYDLFKTVFEDGKWSTPVNLGQPLNTPNDDEYFTIGGSGEVGYFASSRGGGTLDLYQVDIPEDMRPQPTVVVQGVVTNAKTGDRVGAYVLVEDLNTGEIIAVNKSNSATGKYLVVLPAGRTYSVSANKEAFFFHSERFDVPITSKFQEISKDIALKPIEKGAKVVLNNIFFETGKATLSPQSRVELGKAIDLMKTNPTMIIEVGGHTDNVGDDASNMKLSHERAKAVREYLVKGGIDGARIQAKGYGESNPVATNDTDEGRSANRRTEFIILEF
ncbi:MAG: PD40 domain-containing protein [Bacteroidetes bacterium]|nr:PD40 domain-containing protein [Bacteroidota bacterium]